MSGTYFHSFTTVGCSFVSERRGGVTTNKRRFPHMRTMQPIVSSPDVTEERGGGLFCHVLAAIVSHKSTKATVFVAGRNPIHRRFFFQNDVFDTIPLRPLSTCARCLSCSGAQSLPSLALERGENVKTELKCAFSSSKLGDNANCCGLFFVGIIRVGCLEEKWEVEESLAAAPLKQRNLEVFIFLKT